MKSYTKSDKLESGAIEHEAHGVIIVAAAMMGPQAGLRCHAGKEA